MQKICNKCNIKKNIEEFNFKNKKKQTYSSSCKECHRKYSRIHYNTHKKYYIKKARISNNKCYEDNKNKINSLKHQSGCKYCKEDNPVCLDFHHKDKKDKAFSVSSKTGRISWSSLLKEIQKCDVVCSNCHRKIHAGIL